MLNKIKTTCAFLVFAFIYVLSNAQVPASISPSLTTQPNVDSTLKALKTSLDSINGILEKGIVRVGVSIGYNTVWANQQGNYQSPSIDIKDTTLKLQNIDRYSVKISTSLVVTPFLKAKWLKKAIKYNNRIIAETRNKNEEIIKKRIEAKNLNPEKCRHAINRENRRIKTGRYISGLFLSFLNNVGIAANINLLEFKEAQSQLTFNKSIEGGVGFCLRLQERVYLSISNELYFSRQLRDNIKARENEKLYLNGKIVTSINQLDVNDDNLFITRSLIAWSYKIIIVF
jgi:hypothetical protein